MRLWDEKLIPGMRLWISQYVPGTAVNTYVYTRYLGGTLYYYSGAQVSLCSFFVFVFVFLSFNVYLNQIKSNQINTRSREENDQN